MLFCRNDSEIARNSNNASSLLQRHILYLPNQDPKKGSGWTLAESCERNQQKRPESEEEKPLRKSLKQKKTLCKAIYSKSKKQQGSLKSWFYVQFKKSSLQMDDHPGLLHAPPSRRKIKMMRLPRCEENVIGQLNGNAQNSTIQPSICHSHKPHPHIPRHGHRNPSKGDGICFQAMDKAWKNATGMVPVNVKAQFFAGKIRCSKDVRETIFRLPWRWMFIHSDEFGMMFFRGSTVSLSNWCLKHSLWNISHGRIGSSQRDECKE